MKSFLHHLQVNIDPKHIEFYKNFMSFLGLELIVAGEGFAGYKSGEQSSVWFMPAENNTAGNYDTHGVNHIGFGANSMEEVNKMVDWLTLHDIKPLFDTPKHRPDFESDTTKTYYQIMFESPDKLLFEIVYTGKL